ncbi:MAG: hypothetical protein LIR50_21300 [Bacillota bacterium]|nr:hypothetical protein [Bacillota bacterium]
MTNREFFNSIIANEALSDEIRAFAETAVGKLDTANEKRRNAQSKKAQENLPYVQYIVGSVLSDQPMTASDVTEKINAGLGTEFKVQKVSALLRAAVAAGDAVAQDVKIPKKGVQKGYTLPAESVESVESAEPVESTEF